MGEQDLRELTLVEVASLVRRKEMSPVELVEGYLRRIEALDPTLNAYITVAADEALRCARQAEDDGGARPGAGAAPRRAARHQGPLRHTRPAHHRRLQDPRRLGSRGGRPRGRPAAARGGFAPRQAQHARVGGGRHQHQPPLRADCQPLGHHAHPRRLQRRVGGRRRRCPVRWLPGQRHRRLHTHTVVVLRDSGAEAHLRAGQPARRATAELVAGPRGADDAHGGGRRSAHGGNRGLRSRGPCVGRPAGERLPRCPPRRRARAAPGAAPQLLLRQGRPGGGDRRTPGGLGLGGRGRSRDGGGGAGCGAGPGRGHTGDGGRGRRLPREVPPGAPRRLRRRCAGLAEGRSGADRRRLHQGSAGAD